jgi:hypothetical protein
MPFIAKAVKSHRSQQYAYLSYCTLRIWWAQHNFYGPIDTIEKHIRYIANT